MNRPRGAVRASARLARIPWFRAPALALLLLLGATAPAVAQLAMRTPRMPRTARAVILRDTAFVDAVIRLDIDGGPSDVIPALVRDSVLLLPVRQLFTMVGIRMPAFALRDSAVAVLEPGEVVLRFRPGTQELTLGGASVPHDSLDVTWWDGDLFVTTSLLDRLLGVRTAVEWTNLSVLIGRSSQLPVVARARRERRRQVLLAQGRPAPDVLDIPLRERAVDGAVLSWSLTAASSGPTDQRALELGFGAGLLGGSAEVRPVFWSNPGASGSELRVSWLRAWAGSRWVTQARLGDVHTGGRRAMIVDGAAITNAPYIRSSQFDVEQFVGEVPPGWEVELYEGSRLLGYGSADALGTFRVPLGLRYGQNPFELVMYGPGGEQVRQKRTIRVPFSRLPDGRFEYALAAGACRYDPCDALVSADARYGLSSNVTLQGGWDTYFGNADRTLWQPYAIVSAAPLPTIRLTGEAVVNGHVRAAADYELNVDLRASAAHTRFARAGLEPGALFTAAMTEGSFFWRPTYRGGTTYLQGAAVLTTGPGMRRDLERLSANARIGIFRYGLGFLHDEQQVWGRTMNRRVAIDASADAILMGPWSWLRRASAQGLVAVEPGTGFSAMRAMIGRPIARRLRLDAGIGWFRGSGVSLEVNFSTAMPGPRLGTRTRVTSQTGSEAMVYANGSAAYDPRSGLVRFGDQADLGRAGIAGVLFRDDNANGRRDGDEPGLAGVPVSVGGWLAQTDANGRFSAWGLFPVEPVQVEVDSLSLGSPNFALPAAVIRVRPAPNSFGSIEIPVIVGGEVSGFVVFRDHALAGVPVILRELNTGAEIHIMTFTDGGFYRGAVPPGEYEVTLPEQLLDQLGADAPPLSIFIPPGAGEKRFADVHLRLEPRQ